MKNDTNNQMMKSNGLKKKDEVDMSDFKISDALVRLVDSFLTKFTIVSESSMNEHMDIMLMLKALHNRITRVTIE
jgi:hypothetical protein